ncbi:MAG: alpha-galactosidase, partial [Catenulispora sp.]|nr:alpha-galactosidase [Catenulispora sp.]
MAGIWQPHDRAAAPAESVIRASDLILHVTARVPVTSTVRQAGEGIAEVHVTPDQPAVVRAAWQLPCVDATAFWTPDSGEHRGLPPF